MTSSCADVCGDALSYAKGKGESYKSLVTIIEDCIDICAVRAQLEKRGSALLADVKKLCAEACSRCATACESMKDEHLKNCIQECRSCTTSCGC